MVDSQKPGHKLSIYSYIRFNLHRLIIAAMHFNENFGREQAITKSGKEQMRLTFSKQKPGECTPKIVTVPPTFSKTNLCMNLCLI